MLIGKIVDTAKGFAELTDAWNELTSHSDVNHVYMKHQWFAEWIGAYGASHVLCIITLWRDGLLVAAAPLYRTSFSFKGVRAQGLSFLSSGVTPRCNFLLSEPSLLENVMTEVFRLPGWDVCLTDRLDAEATTTVDYVAYLRQSLPSSQYRAEDDFRSFYLNTRTTWEEYWDSLVRDRQKYLEKYCVRRPAKAPSCIANSISDEAEFLHVLPTLLEISSRSWKASGQGELTTVNPLGQFLRNFTPIGLRHGWVRIYVLWIGGKAVAYEYLLRFGNKYTAIRADFDEDFRYYSPGSTLRLAILKDLHTLPAITEYEMGAGDDAYKQEWCDRSRTLLTVTFANHNFKGKSILYAKTRLLPAARRLTGLLPSRLRHA